MSPEQVSGSPTGPATDVFSWACTVAYAATGRSPFGDGPTDAILFRVRHDPANLDGLPPELSALLGGALAKEPSLLLGAWWALADWCGDNGHGRAGECYDLASNFVVKWFGYDPRRINTQTWVGAGAIAGSVDEGYNATEFYLWEIPPERGTSADSFAGRPGYDLLCEPSCVAALDGG